MGLHDPGSRRAARDRPPLGLDLDDRVVVLGAEVHAGAVGRVHGVPRLRPDVDLGDQVEARRAGVENQELPRQLRRGNQVAPVRRQRELHEGVRRAVDVGELDVARATLHHGDAVLDQRGREDAVAFRIDDERVGPREEDVELLDAHLLAHDGTDALRRIDRHHRAPHVQLVRGGVDRQEAGSLERSTADQLAVGGEAQHVPAADERDVPVPPVRVDRRIVGAAVGVEAEFGHVDRAHDLAAGNVDDRDARRGLVGDVDALAAGRLGGGRGRAAAWEPREACQQGEEGGLAHARRGPVPGSA